MATFFVGQRVRVLACEEPQAVGAEGRIIGEGRHRFDDCWVVSVLGKDDWWVEKRLAGYVLSPILPEGAAPSEFTFQQLMENVGMVPA